MKTIITYTLLILSMVSNAQIFNNANDYEKYCGFPDNGLSEGDHDKGKKNKKGIISMFKVGSGYYYNNQNTDLVHDVFHKIKGHYNYSRDLTRGLVYPGAEISIGAEAMENRYDYHGFKINSLKVYEVTNSGNVIVPSSNHGENKKDGTPGDARWTYVKFTPKASTTYKIEFKFQAKYNSRGSKLTGVRTSHMYLCVSGPGGITGWGESRYAVDAKAYQQCQSTEVKISGRKSGYKYYWSETSTSVVQDPEFLIPVEGFSFSESKTIYVHGVLNSYHATPKRIDVVVIESPKAPTYTGNYLQCDCAVEFSGIPGAGGSSLVWKYDEPTSCDDESPKLLTGADGVSSDGLYVGLGGEDEEIIKNTKQISLATYSKVNGKECISNWVDVNYETAACHDCEATFLLGKGKKYVISSWAKQQDNLYEQSYSAPEIKLEFSWQGGKETFQFKPEGNIIDGWQKIEAAFVVPPQTETMQLTMSCDEATGGRDCYFDDIRLHPFEASMVTYVYDPNTLQLNAELDNNNMYVKYTYDEQGILTSSRVETLDGARTVAESRTNIQTK